MIKILAVSDAYTEPYTRVGLFKPASAKEFEISIIIPKITAENSPEGFELLKRDFPDVHLLDSRLNFHHSVRCYSRQLAPLIRKIQPDILFINNEPWSSAAFQAVSACKSLSARPKIVVYTSENQLRRFLPPFGYFQSVVLNNSDLVLTVTREEGKKVLLEKGYTGRIGYLPLSVDTGIFRKMPDTGLRSRLVADSSAFLLGFVGRLVPEKGIGTILEALAACPGTGLAILGSGPEKGRIESAAERLGVAGRVRILDSVFYDKLPSYMSSFDALVLPSLTTRNWKEQFGRVLVEAMACETPVIGSNSGEIPQVIGDAGLIFRENDAVGLAGAVMKLKNDPAAARVLAQKGRKRVEELFSRKAVDRLTEEIFRKVVNESIV